MPSFLRRSGKLLRRAGRLARSACRSACCGGALYVRRDDCCFSDRTDWILTTALCPNTGHPVWPGVRRFIGGVRADGTRQCSVTDPFSVRTRAQILASDPGAVIRDTLTEDCQDGNCSDAPCTCAQCCASGRPTNRCNNNQQLCCECGADFTFFFTMLFDYEEDFQDSGALLGNGQCGGGCQATISSPYPNSSIHAAYTLALDYHCLPDGGFDVVCSQYALSVVTTRYTVVGYPPGWPLGADPNHPCPPASGWLPTQSIAEERCEESGCQNNACFGNLRLDPTTVCSMDAFTAKYLAGLVVPAAGMDMPRPGFDPNNPVDWADYRAHHCSGDLRFTGDPIEVGCPGDSLTLPAPSNRWRWTESVQCLRGSIREGATWSSQGFGTGGPTSSGRFRRNLNWITTRHEPCVEPPCPPSPVLGATPSSVSLDDSDLFTDFVTGSGF